LSKLRTYDVAETLSHYEFICIQETWDIDVEDEYTKFFPNHTVYTCQAKSSSRGGRSMGGSVILVKNVLTKYVKRVCENFPSGVLLVIDKPLFKLDKDTLFVNLYVPPEGSPFYNDNDSNVIASLEATFEEHNLLDLYFAMVGDFNARTGKLCDTSGFDNNIPELQEFSDMFVDTFDIERRSCDSVTNKFGRILLQFCQTYDMVISNGRFGPESEQYTFMNKNGCSVIDYLIISKSMFRLINNFAVLSNSESCHFPISIALRIF